MAKLDIKIGSSLIVFSGAGTFEAKDRIKQLGAARWNVASKVWELRAGTLSQEQLKEIFPEASIQVINISSEKEQSQESKEISNTLVQDTFAGAYSVSQITSEIKKLLCSVFPSTILVYGVVSTVKEMSDGRIFLELSEIEREEERLSCVIWRNAEQICKPLNDLGFKLEVDLQAMFKAQIDITKRNSISLSIVGVVPEYTITRLAAKREQTNERLRQEGIFSKNKGLKLPFLPIRLGLLTSAGGTVINDFLASLNVCSFNFELCWYDTKVQGVDAKEAVIRGLEILQSLNKIDAILIFRGGGSPADLAVFNEYEVAKAVCLCSLPVISAIGHQKDSCSVQDVSYLEFGVPKDIGRFFSDLVIAKRIAIAEFMSLLSQFMQKEIELAEKGFYGETKSVFSLASKQTAMNDGHLLNLIRQIPRASQSSVFNVSKYIKVAFSSIPLKCEQSASFADSKLYFEVRTFLNAIKQRLALLVQKLASSIKVLCFAVERQSRLSENRCVIAKELARTGNSLVQQIESKTENFARLLEEASIEKQLKRGFVLVKEKEKEKYVTLGKKLKQGDNIWLEFYDIEHLAIITGDKEYGG